MPRTVTRQHRQGNGNGLGLYLVQTLNSLPVPCPRPVIETDEENKLLDKIFNYLLAQILSLFELFEYCLIR